MFQLWSTRKNNSKPVQNKNEIKFITLHAGEDASSEFGVFHNIHHYFRDKYLADWSHEDFYFRAKDFFQELIIRLENRKNNAYLSAHSVKYIALYNNLMRQELTRESIISYFNTLTVKAQIATGKEKLFYQRYLVRVALPILMMSTGMVKEDFDKIIENIPSKMLHDEQRTSTYNANGLIEFSSLFTMLSESTHPDAIDRFCKISERMSQNKNSLVSRSCLMGGEILKEISQCADIFSGVKPAGYRNIRAIILRKLLLSARQEDRVQAIKVVRARLDNKSLIVDIFCSSFFWMLLEEKSGRHSVSNTTEIFSLLRDAVFANRQSGNSVKLHTLLVESCLIDNVTYAPHLNVKNLSAEACAIFFALACHDYSKDCFVRENLKNILQVCEKSGRAFDLEKIALIKFLLNDSSPSRQGRLNRFREKIQQNHVPEKEANLICQYIFIKQKLYGKDICLSRCLTSLQALYPVSGGSLQSASRFYPTTTSNPAAAPVSLVLM